MEMITFQHERDEDESTTSTNDSESNAELTESDSGTKENETNLPPSSLLALLDDKNRSICLLKKQIHNQKIQLDFYLRRVFNSPRVVELAGSCVPHETEDNIQINLAMNKFCKQVGLKSRIMSLHARMTDMEKRIFRMTDQQEDMVRTIVNKLLEFTQNSTNDATTIQLCLNQLQGDSGQVETLAKVLGATNKLRKELDAFRTCCNRLIVIEDERNSLVEQVYAMPVTHRMSYGVLLAVQYEKMRLEKEVQEIKQEQKILQERLAQLSPAGSPCSEKVQAVSGSNSSGDKTNVRMMLEAVNSEAVTLLTITQEQKDKYVQQISKLRETNTELAKRVVSLQQVAGEKEELEARMELATKEFQKLRERDQEQLNEFNIRLETVIEEKDVLSNKLQHYNNIEEQVKYLRTQVQDMDTLRRQRDYYKLQVDNLQAIRAAYAQLVEHCPTRSDEGDNKEQKRKVEELEKRNAEMASETESLGEVIMDQEVQIKHLLMIIEKLATYEETQIPTQISHTVYSVHSTNNPDTKPQGTHIMHNKDSAYTSESKSVYSETDTDLQMVIKELQKPQRPIPPSQSEYGSSKTLTRTGTEDEWIPDCFEKVYKNKNNCVLPSERSSQSMCEFMTTHEEELSKTNSISFREATRGSQRRHISQILNDSQTNPHISTTSVEVQSVNYEGKSESLKAILESSSPIEGVIEVNNSTALSLRLTCNPSCKQNKETSVNTFLVPIASEPEIDNDSDKSCLIIASVMDEYELMKDSSTETMAVTLPSVHHQLVAVQHAKYTYNKRERLEETEQNSLFTAILNRNDGDVDVVISKETMPSENVSDSAEDDHNGNETDADEDVSNLKTEDEKGNYGGTKDEAASFNDLTSRLKLITSDLDWTLSQPGGKDSLLRAVKHMYNTLLRDDAKI